MLIKTKAIVLHSLKYGESKLIIDMLTPGEGRMSCIAALARRPRAGLKPQYFQPLTMIEAVIDVRRTASLHRVREARVAVPYASIPFSPAKTAIALFTAEFLRAATRREPADGLTYDYVENSLSWLDGCRERFANFHLVFTMRMTKFLGFYPNTDGYAPGSRFDLRSGAFTAGPPTHADCLPPDESAGMLKLLRMNYPNMHLFKMTRAERNRMAEVILRYYEIHIPDFPELKSFAVLKDLFG